MNRGCGFLGKLGRGVSRRFRGPPRNDGRLVRLVAARTAAVPPGQEMVTAAAPVATLGARGNAFQAGTATVAGEERVQGRHTARRTSFAAATAHAGGRQRAIASPV